MKFLEDSELAPLRVELDRFELCLKSAPDDPKTEPYRHKYLAMGCLENMQEKINIWVESEHTAAIQSAVLTAYGVLKAETEELTLGEQLLSKSLETCDKVCEEKFTILSRLQALIYLGVIWCGREDYKMSREYLEKSLKVYALFREENNQEIYSLKDLLGSVDQFTLGDQTKTLESYITHAYYYLAQVEGKSGDTAKSAELCHKTLSRQLLGGELDWVDWARNSATLSQFYLNQENFTAARYHLAAALTIIQKEDQKKLKIAWDDIADKSNNEFKSAYNEQIAINDNNKSAANSDDNKSAANDQKSAVDKSETTETMTTEVATDDDESPEEEMKQGLLGNVSRFCAKYGLALLEYSHCEKLTKDCTDPRPPVHQTPRFDDLDVSEIENQVTDSAVYDFESARLVFLWAQKHTTQAQNYFSLDERCSDYVELTRDLSQMYKHLLAFEDDDDRKCKMHRRRADLLEPLHRELHPDHYLLTIRQILFELGEIFSDMVDLKRQRWQTEQANPKFLKKVNQLVNQAILYFQTFLDTMKVEGKDPDKYNDDTVRPALLANFYLGRLASKFVVEENSPAELENIALTYMAYKKIVDYCEKNPEAKEKVGEELEACAEMVRLLPVKMEKVKRSLTL